ncbi:MAG TPA: NAD(P)H-binding protein [Micromonosporaceae bacterium]
MILVTGATGTVGRHVAVQLSDMGVDVRAMVHRTPAVDLPDRVKTVEADLAVPESLADHLDGVDAVFLVWPFVSPDQTAELAPRVVAELTKRPRRIVYLSATPAADEPGSFWARVEQAIRDSGAPHTFLRPSGFAKNVLMWADQIRSGDEVRWTYGDAVRSLIHEADIAAVAVRALVEDGHDGKAYALTGPSAHRQAEQVEIIGEVLGRPLRWVELPVEAAREQLRQEWGDAGFADAALAAWARFVTEPEPVTSVVQQVTGRPARSFRQWVAEHVDAFR